MVSGPGQKRSASLSSLGSDVARQFVGLRQRGDQQRKRLVLLPALEPIDTFDRVQVYGVHGQTVKSIGGHGNDIAFAQTGDNVVNPVWLGLVGMDAQNFRGQEGLPRFPQTIHNCRFSWQLASGSHSARNERRIRKTSRQDHHENAQVFVDATKTEAITAPAVVQVEHERPFGKSRQNGLESAKR